MAHKIFSNNSVYQMVFTQHINIQSQFLSCLYSQVLYLNMCKLHEVICIVHAFVIHNLGSHVTPKDRPLSPSSVMHLLYMLNKMVLALSKIWFEKAFLKNLPIINGPEFTWSLFPIVPFNYYLTKLIIIIYSKYLMWIPINIVATFSDDTIFSLRTTICYSLTQSKHDQNNRTDMSTPCD
jgi:hypothetical protein